MRIFLDYFFAALALISWILGIAAAQGWHVFFSILFAPYAWLVLAQKLTGW